MSLSLSLSRCCGAAFLLLPLLLLLCSTLVCVGTSLSGRAGQLFRLDRFLSLLFNPLRLSPVHHGLLRRRFA